jgi:hypothetical protein
VLVENATMAQMDRQFNSFFNRCARYGWVVKATPRPLHHLDRDPVPIVHEAEWAPLPVRTGEENLALTGIRSPDLPVRSELVR